MINRSYLFAPGHNAKLLSKVFTAGADAVILDLEDAVAIAEKPATRDAVVAAFGETRTGLLYVRVNAADTEFCHADFSAIVRPGLDGIILPKVESAATIQTIDLLLKPRGLERPPLELVEPMNIRLWEAGMNATYAERARMQMTFNTVSRSFGAFFEEWDIILTPTMAKPTPKLGTKEYMTTSDNPSVLDWFHNLWGIFAFTPLANLCGIPGISMPLGVHPNGLPMGIQAQTRQAGDGLLLQLAAQIERALDGTWDFIRCVRTALERRRS